MPEPMPDPPASRGSRVPVRMLGLSVLLACVVGALAFLIASRGQGGSSACPYVGSPNVVNVSSRSLSPLRSSVEAALPQRIGRLYEEGTVVAGDAWSDGEPSPPPLSPAALRPGAYEMRWWAPDHDDIVADVFTFASTAAAKDFMGRASSARCRRTASQGAALRPAGASNLAWINPDGYVQVDVFLLRGTRVYRVGDVPSRQSAGSLRRGGLRRGFATVDALACLLPDAGCSLPSAGSPV